MSVAGMLIYDGMLKKYGGDLGKYYDVPSLEEFKKSKGTAQPKLKPGYTRSSARMEGEGVGEMVYAKGPRKVRTFKGKDGSDKYGMTSGTYIYKAVSPKPQAQEAPAQETPAQPEPEKEPLPPRGSTFTEETQRYKDTRLQNPGNQAPRMGFTNDAMQDAIRHGEDLNAHYVNRFIPSLEAEARLTAQEIGESGRFNLNRFVGKIPELGDIKELTDHYIGEVKKAA